MIFFKFDGDKWGGGHFKERKLNKVILYSG